MDPSGKSIQDLYRGRLNNGVNAFTFPLNSQLSAGVYFVEIKDESQRYFVKVMKK